MSSLTGRRDSRDVLQFAFLGWDRDGKKPMNAEAVLLTEIGAALSSGFSSGDVGCSIQCVSRVKKIVSITKSHIVSDRVSWSDVEIKVVGGRCRVHFHDRVIECVAKQRLQISAMVEHSIEAIDDTRLVLSFKNPDFCKGEQQ